MPQFCTFNASAHAIHDAEAQRILPAAESQPVRHVQLKDWLESHLEFANAEETAAKNHSPQFVSKSLSRSTFAQARSDCIPRMQPVCRWHIIAKSVQVEATVHRIYAKQTFLAVNAI